MCSFTASFFWSGSNVYDVYVAKRVVIRMDGLRYGANIFPVPAGRPAQALICSVTQSDSADAGQDSKLELWASEVDPWTKTLSLDGSVASRKLPERSFAYKLVPPSDHQAGTHYHIKISVDPPQVTWEPVGDSSAAPHHV